jgi:hypothetical protein
MQKAVKFDTFVEKLRAVGVDVTVVDDTLDQILQTVFSKQLGFFS